MGNLAENLNLGKPVLPPWLKHYKAHFDLYQVLNFNLLSITYFCQYKEHKPHVLWVWGGCLEINTKQLNQGFCF